ncbi:MAG: gamma-glutamyltransferase [Chlamydiales bacterium]|nr:gamma-glutamyltransferase [Chlamydiales bacterium]
MLLFTALLFPLLGQIDLQPEAPTGFVIKKAVFGERMMVASANPKASKIGFHILKRGGSAVDAAIAIQMALTLVEPQSSGIGGGGFLLYYSKKEGKIIAYDGRETAPSGIDISRVPNIIGGKSVGVPGVLRMLEMAHKEGGMLPWKDLFEPAIKLAEEGFPISSRLHKLIQCAPNLYRFLEPRAYLFENGKPKPEGALLKNWALARSLRAIAEEGAAPFYTGEIAREIVKAVQEASFEPGTLSLEDLANYRPVKREPILSNYRGYTVYGFPPPSSGGIAVAQILGMLGSADLGQETLCSPELIDLFCKASRAAHAVSNQYVGDPAFINVPVNHLLSPISFAHLLKNPTKTAIRAYEHPSTSQICVVDREGNAVSFTTSIEHAFGSALMAGGFFLNNQMTDFSTGPNRIEPGKRPMSSMSPTFLFDGDQLILSVGSAGGPRIIDYVAKTLFGVIDFGLNIQEAISLPNFTSLTPSIDIEKNTFLESEVSALEAMGNRVISIPLTSGTQGIQITPSALIGGVDPRREGLAIGE